MYPSTIVAVISILAASIVIRSLDILKFHAFGVDTFGNLLYSEGLKSGSLNLYKVGKDALIVYPHFLPWLLYHLRRLPVRALHIIPKLFDMLTSVIVFLFTLWFSGNEFMALLALLIYTFSPINVINGFGIGTRNIGSFFFALTLLASYVAAFDIQVKYVMFCLAIVSCLLMMLTSRIAYKSYFLLAIAMIPLSPLSAPFQMVLLVSAISLVLCLLVTRGGFIKDCKAQIFLINFFRKRKEKEKSLMKRITLIFYYDLWWCIGILAIINGANLFLATWLCAMLTLSFLWPWGEGERHVAFAVVPASILVASILYQQVFIVIPVLILEIFVLVRISINVLRGRHHISIDRSLQNLLNIIKNVEGDPLFLCLPLFYSFPIAYSTKKKVLYGDGTSQKGILFQAEMLNAVKTESSLEELSSKYPVTHLFVDKNYFTLTINAESWEPVIQDDRFGIFTKKTQKTNNNINLSQQRRENFS